VEYVGIDWAYRRAAWCAMTASGAISAEGAVPADEDGLARLVLRVGTDVRACVEMMSGAVGARPPASRRLEGGRRARAKSP
jgi:hypothetical protein